MTVVHLTVTDILHEEGKLKKVKAKNGGKGQCVVSSAFQTGGWLPSFANVELLY